jgi:hypothetical protein
MHTPVLASYDARIMLAMHLEIPPGLPLTRKVCLSRHGLADWQLASRTHLGKIIHGAEVLTTSLSQAGPASLRSKKGWATATAAFYHTPQRQVFEFLSFK